jgi:Tol biopolymer transport system component
MKPALLLAAVLFAITRLDVANAQLRFDPRVRWQTFESPHCVIHYPRGEDSLAQAVAQKTEWYHQRLSEIFHEAPADKIEVVLDTSSDVVFGAATPFPNSTVFLNPTSTAFELGHYDDWLDLLISHELTHAVDLDKLGGLPGALRTIFGRLYFPGAFGPQWLTEGIATYFESELTGQGRGVSPYHDMIVRMAFLEGRVTTPDQNNIFLARWPGGNSSYVYGQSFYRYIVGQYGQEAVIKLRERYAGNWIPFRANEAMRAATSHGLKKVYGDWKAAMQLRYEKQADTIRALGLTASRQLTQNGFNNWSPEWSADGETIYFIAGDPDQHPAIRAAESATGKQRRLQPVNVFETQMSYAAGAQRERLFFSQIELARSYSVRHDLWVLDLRTGKRRRLTQGQRARHPAVDPFGEKVAYIANNAGQTDLWLYDIRSKKSSRLRRGGPDQLFFNPAWSPDGKRLALSIWQRGGYQDIWILNLEDQSLRPLLQDKAWDVTPCWSHDGRYVVFSSDRTGVFNLFAYDLEFHRLLQITNVLGGAFDPALSRDDGQIAFAGYSSRGYDIHIMDWRKDQAVRAFNAVLGTDIPPSPDFVYGYVDTIKASQPLPSSAAVTTAPKSYNPLRTMRPRFYIPLPTVDEKGQGFGVFTYGQDVLSKHAYLLMLQYGIRSARLGYALSYSNNSFHPILNLQLSDLAVPRAQNVFNENGEVVTYWERRREQAAGIVIPFIKIDTAHLFGIGVRLRHFAKAERLLPGQSNPYFEGNLRSLEAQYVFSNAHRFPRSISPVEGMSFAVSFEQFSTRLKSDLDFHQIFSGVEKFVRVPGSRRHVLQVGALAGRNNLKTIKEIENMPEAAIRGFPTFTWTSELYQGTIEYRFPLGEIERSTPLLPIFMKRLHAGLFADAAQYKNVRERHTRLQSIGLELRLDLVFGYLLESRLELGAAFPLRSKENPSVYFNLAAGL